MHDEHHGSSQASHAPPAHLGPAAAALAVAFPPVPSICPPVRRQAPARGPAVEVGPPPVPPRWPSGGRAQSPVVVGPADLFRSVRTVSRTGPLGADRSGGPAAVSLPRPRRHVRRRVRLGPR